jgi:hypothetical protein
MSNYKLLSKITIGGAGGAVVPMLPQKVVSPAHINNEAIAGHNAAIDTYIKVIRDLMPMNGINELVDTLINQYVEAIAVLRKELQEMKEETTVP